MSTTYVHSGLGFQPKALILWCVGGVATWEKAANFVSLGFAASTSDRRSVGVAMNDATAAMTSASIIRNDACLAISNFVNSVRALLDLQSFDSDGFTLIVDDAIGGTSANDLAYQWMALGGSDITNVGTGEIAEPGATGNVSYTVGAGFQPTVVFFGGNCLTTTANSTGVVDSGLMYGAATGTGSGNQFVFLLNNDEGSSSADVDRYVRFDECLALMTTAGGNPSARATFNGFDSAGFDLNWLARTASTRRFIYLAMAAGSNVAVGKLDIPAVGGWNTAGTTHTVSGLAFQPVGVWMVSGATAENPTAGTSTIPARPTHGPGAFTGTSSRVAMGYQDSSDGLADSACYHTVTSALALYLASSGSTTNLLADVDAITSDGFRLIVEEAESTLVTVSGFVAFGTSAVPTSLPVFPRQQLYRSRRVM